MMARWLGAAGRFWYRFVVGDDWVLAATVTAGLGVAWALHRSGIAAWWVLPLAVVAGLSSSLRRARRTR